MSVVLMRMKKVPGNCCACELRCHDPLTGEEICPKTGRECLSTGRDVLCPIIGVLPDTHGRLVDADRLRHSWLNLKDCGEDFCVETIVSSIDRQEAIVPAAEDLHDAICITMSKEKWNLLGGLIEDVLDTFIEVGNGVTDEMFDHALDQLFDARDLLYGREFEMRTHDYD